MPGFGVIADVSDTLESVINGALGTLTAPPAPIAQVVDLQGSIATNPPTMAIFLYELAEDPSTRNRSAVREEAPAGVQFRKPPLTLVLRYLLAPFAGDRLTEQRMMGRALQALHEHPVFSGPDLRGDPAPAGLVGSSEVLRTVLAPLTLEERTRVWHAVQRPYRLSFSIEIRVANVEPDEWRSVARARFKEIARAERTPA